MAVRGIDWEASDVVRLTVYLVDRALQRMTQHVEGVSRAAAELGIGVPQAPLTGIGVAAPAEPGLLVEVEATAVIASDSTCLCRRR